MIVGRVLRGLRRRGPVGVLRLVHAGAIVTGIEIGLRTVRLPRLCQALGIRLDLPTLRESAVDSAAAGRRTGAMPANAPLAGSASVVDQDQRPAPAFHGTAAELALVADTQALLAWGPVPSTCLRRALAAGWVLRHHEPSLQLGVQKAGGQVSAHAWLVADGVNLDPTGAADFTPLTRR